MQDDTLLHINITFD